MKLLPKNNRVLNEKKLRFEVYDARIDKYFRGEIEGTAEQEEEIRDIIELKALENGLDFGDLYFYIFEWDMELQDWYLIDDEEESRR